MSLGSAGHLEIGWGDGVCPCFTVIIMRGDASISRELKRGA